MKELRAGEDAALDELMRRYRHPLLNFVYRLLGNAADAEEIAQQVFVRVYQRAADYDPQRTFSTWLFALARHAAIDRLRWRARHPTTSLDEPIEPATTVTAASEVIDRELGEQVAAAIAALPEDQRSAIILSEYHGLSDAAIGEVLGCSPKAVGARLYRARQALRRQLGDLLAE